MRANNEPQVVIDWNVGDFHIYIDCDFTVEEVHGVGVGDALIKWGDLELLKEKLVILQYLNDEIILSGNAKLFHHPSVFQLEGLFQLNTTKSHFGINGDAKVSLLGFILAGCTLHLAEKHVAFNGKLFGNEITFIVSKEPDLLVVGKTVKDQSDAVLLIKDFSSITKIQKNTGQTDFSFTFAEFIDLKGHFDYGSNNAHGTVDISFLKNKLFTGTLDVKDNIYDIHGNLDVFPASTAATSMQFNIHLDGKFDDAGLTLVGSNSVGIIGLLNLFTKASINNGMPELQSKVTVLGADYIATSGLYPYNGNIAFCMSYVTPPVYVWFITWMQIIPAITYYFMVSPAGLYGPSFFKPSGWPAAADALPIADASTQAIRVKEEELPTPKQSIEHIIHLLDAAIDAPCTLTHQAALLTTLIYRAEFNAEAERAISLFKTEALAKIENNIFSQLARNAADLAEVDELIFQKINGRTTVTAKSKHKVLKTFADNFFGIF
ncbi:MAG: hypothetical protein PHQ60_13230 [Sideroxydans sp.]|nr:hypothetical protein [Sideroxydans sp.]